MAQPDQDSVRITESFGFDAPAEVVFGVLTDPDRTSRWLPRGMTAEPADAGVGVRVGEHTHKYDVEVTPERLRLGWQSVEGPFHGGAEVRDAPAGGSEVVVELDVPAADADRARDLLTETAGHLRRDVDDNFTAG